MRLLSCTLERVGGPLARGVGNARAAWSSREGIRVRLRDDEGITGLGECSPLPGYSQSTLDECAAALAAFDGEELPRATTSPLDLPALAAACAPLPPPARFAVETAWLDLATRRAGRSISELLGELLGERLGAISGHTVARSGLLPVTEDLAAALAAARALQARGVGTIKVKIGRPGADFARELRWLGELRAALGPEIRLRLDANGAFSLAEAPDRLAQLAPLRPELVEEPTGAPGLSLLGECALPWAADESLADEATTRQILDRGACSALVLKPANLGLLRCLDLATEARQRGIKLLVTHLFDGPVGLAAACELALALGGELLPCGLDLHEGLLAYPPMDIPQLRVPGAITPSGRPGHGLE